MSGNHPVPYRAIRPDPVRQPQAEGREHRARLDAMLFIARDLAAGAARNLAMSTGAIQRHLPDGDLDPQVRDTMDAATTGLREATRAIAEIQRVIGAGSVECVVDHA